MAGRIRDEDIAEVREKVRIDDVVSEYVTLRRAGGGSMKGLCPFHDERSPSFHVTPARGFFHCFGCQEGGDAISFLMKIDGLSFSEAVEHLADKVGIQIRREEGDEPQRPRGPQRSRLIEAHKIAQEFYADQLTSPDALTARQFLSQRGFDQDAAAMFGVGFAPRDGDALHKLLSQRGFSTEEMTVSGLVAQGRSLYDRFRGRLLWPIRESNGDTVGFGARRIFEDDRIDAKYLNSSETPIYKKSQVLYGLDLARREIAKSSRAVIVEGYTDVMACHLAGVPVAVATCGTAFGDDHARVLRRFMGDDKKFHGEVIFTFDGDAAGQKAALRAFQGDQNFVSQTYVAVEPGGMDPCDLRLAKGDEAVRELIETREPLYRFVLGNVVSKFDLDRADGRVDALREASRLVSSVRDRSKVDAFARELASLVGVDANEALTQVRRAEKWSNDDRSKGEKRPETRRPDPRAETEPPQQAGPQRPPMPSLRDPRFSIERETLKLILQHTNLVDRPCDQVTADDFGHPVYRAVWQSIETGGGVLAAREDPMWVTKLHASLTNPFVASAVAELGVEPVRSAGDPTDSYVRAHLYRLLQLTVERRIADVKSRLQRADPSDPEAYNQVFAELMGLEQRRRSLIDKAVSA